MNARAPHPFRGYRVLTLLRLYGIGVACLVALFFIARSSLDPEQYFRYFEDEPAVQIENPTRIVAFISAVLFIEGAVLYLVLRPWRAGWPWRRALIALLIFFAWFSLCVMVIVHAPGYFILHAIWLFAVVIGLALNLLGSVVWSLANRQRQKPLSSANAAG